MICPRCSKDTTLWIQRVGQDEKAGAVVKEAPKVFLCEGCKADWISVSTHFKKHWKKTRKMPLVNADFNMMYGMFLRENKKYGKVSKPDAFAQVAVGIVGACKGDFSRREAIFIPAADLVTSEDYAWAAGVVDACGKLSSQDNPGKICLVVSHEDRRILERLRELAGGNINEVRGKKGVFSFTTTRRNSEAFLRRIKPYLKCREDVHPEEVSEDDRMLAWIAGFAQASAKDGIIRSDCKWAIRLMSTLFEGAETEEGKMFSFAPEPQMRERLAPFVLRKSSLSGAQDSTDGSDSREVAAFRYARGEGRALRVPQGSQPERPPGPKLNVVAGSNPAGEGSQGDVAFPPKLKDGTSGPTDPSVWEGPPSPETPDPTPEIEVSGDTQVRLQTQSENCIVCRKIMEDLEKDKGVLKAGKEVTLRGKISHLFSEFGVELRSECPACQEEILLQFWADDWLMCSSCNKLLEKVGRAKAADDKAWASK